MKGFTIAGIGTEVGKTLISSMLVEGLKADYWKPVQSGDLHFGDTDKLRSWVDNTKSIFHPEAYRLTQPMSPHAAAEIDNIEIKVRDFELPQTDNTLIVELAGGVMVPLNHHQTNVDLINHIGLPVILVANYYLGSINHTLLTIEVLRLAGNNPVGIIFTGETVPATRDLILDYAHMDLIGEVPYLPSINKALIHTYGQQLANQLIEIYDN